MRAEFDDSLVTGNEMIDGQHKELIDKINKLLDSCETSKDKLVAIKTLDYLADYTEFHFGEEEKLQEDIQYPGIEAHKKEHDKLREVVKELCQNAGGRGRPFQCVRRTGEPERDRMAVRPYQDV